MITLTPADDDLNGAASRDAIMAYAKIIRRHDQQHADNIVAALSASVSDFLDICHETGEFHCRKETPHSFADHSVSHCESCPKWEESQ